MKKEDIVKSLEQCDKKIARLQEQLDIQMKRRNAIMLESVVDTLETNKMSLQDFFNLVEKEKKKTIINDFRGDKNI